MSKRSVQPQPRRFNKKRRVQKRPDPSVLTFLAQTVKYRGHPYHKQNPGNFRLTPPAQAMPGKTLCDDVGIFTREVAQELLRLGAARGLISVQTHGRFPQNIWSMSTEGFPLEAQLENHEQGTYHGYPMLGADPFRDIVISLWGRS